MRTVIFDIDGTLADNRHRQHFLDRTPKDWDGFFSLMRNDVVFPYVVELYKALQSLGYFMVLCTGRPSNYLEVTSNWLFNNDLTYNELHMRKAGDMRADTIVKQEMLDYFINSGKYNISFCVDDRPDVVKMWRSNGIPCFQVDDSLWFEIEK